MVRLKAILWRARPDPNWRASQGRSGTLKPSKFGATHIGGKWKDTVRRNLSAGKMAQQSNVLLDLARFQIWTARMGLKAACASAQPGKKTASRSRGANKQQQFSGRRVLQHCSNCGSIGKVAHTPTVICKNSIQQRLKLEIPWARSEEAAQEGDPKVDKKAGKIGQTCDTRWKMDTNYQLVIK